MAKKSNSKAVKPGNRARAATLAVDKPLPGGIKVREITLAIGALLEEVDSPFIDGRKPERFMEMLPTFFIMTRSAKESQELLAQGREVFDDAALAWADSVPVTVCTTLSAACAASKARLTAVSGGSGGTEGNVPSAATAG